MMNNKNLARLAILTLCLTFVSTSLLGGTLAKYTSNVTASATATVADWSIEVGDTEITVDPVPTVTFGLFSTVKEYDFSGTDDDVATGSLIAPGTGGEFALEIENLSEVSAKYAIVLSEVNDGGIPIEYCVDDGAWKTSIADLSTSLEGELKLGAAPVSATKTIKWRWAFEKDDARDIADTALGIAGTDTVAVTANITVTQLD